VVIATRDRPEDLRGCLASISSQDSLRFIETIVVDNNPDSGLTSKVVEDFPHVILIGERRKGLSYARNRGIAASSGQIILTTDDDVTVPPHWLETLVSPFSKADVMLVTGNILPMELDTKAQILFEEYGGLSRGLENFIKARDWFEHYRFRALPTWELGATANAAFRSEIFSHPEIGLMNEILGVGTPTGCSEDTYLFYKILKAGYEIVYRPDAYVWHRHRKDMAGLRKQIFNYSKGHVAYNLMTLLIDHDLRALVRLLIELPMIYFLRLKEYILRRSKYPPTLLLLEIAGNLAGPFGLLRSTFRVRRLGRSDPYIPPSKRIILEPTRLRVEISDRVESVKF
jgi:GT2 family glycosyltransferase